MYALLYIVNTVINENGTENLNNNLYPRDFRNSPTVNGLPWHTLELKIGAPVILSTKILATKDSRPLKRRISKAVLDIKRRISKAVLDIKRRISKAVLDIKSRLGYQKPSWISKAVLDIKYPGRPTSDLFRIPFNGWSK